PCEGLLDGRARRDFYLEIAAERERDLLLLRGMVRQERDDARLLPLNRALGGPGLDGHRRASFDVRRLRREGIRTVDRPGRRDVVAPALRKREGEGRLSRSIRRRRSEEERRRVRQRRAGTPRLLILRAASAGAEQFPASESPSVPTAASAANAEALRHGFFL